MRFKPGKKEFLAWMQPGASKRRQILSAVRVQAPKGDDPPMAVRMMMLSGGVAATLSRLITKAEAEGEPGARSILLATLDGLGLLQERVSPELPPSSLAQTVLSMDNEVMIHLGPKGTVDLKNLQEVPGARELLDNLTLWEWLEALSQEVQNPE